ncbi:hypothetical protein OBCHQ24_14850 [Oceanobacillus iheyensis]|nr:hypothetical protein OBCHQ24_14850 [Oceanobacillus iheyensis]
MNVILNKYVLVLQKIYWFAYLQALWLLFTLIGLVVLGIFPATHALFTVMKERDLSSNKAFHEFRNAFTRSFIKLNGAGILFGLMLSLISTNIFILESIYIKYLVMGMLGLIFLSMIHFFQYFESKKPILTQIKKAFSIVWILPKSNVGYLSIFILLLLAIAIIPGISFFFGMSVAVFFIVKIGGSEENLKLNTQLTERSNL